MICALTVRTLRSGTFDEFRDEAIGPFVESVSADGLYEVLEDHEYRRVAAGGPR
jgi:hypothetical protein